MSERSSKSTDLRERHQALEDAAKLCDAAYPHVAAAIRALG
jgi:hypothetical protein